MLLNMFTHSYVFRRDICMQSLRQIVVEKRKTSLEKQQFVRMFHFL